MKTASYLEMRFAKELSQLRDIYSRKADLYRKSSEVQPTDEWRDEARALRDEEDLIGLKLTDAAKKLPDEEALKFKNILPSGWVRACLGDYFFQKGVR